MDFGDGLQLVCEQRIVADFEARDAMWLQSTRAGLAPIATARSNARAASATRKPMALADGPCIAAKSAARLLGSAG